MRAVDTVRYVGAAAAAHRTRSFLTATGIAVGITAVVLLTSIGEGVQGFVLSEFTQFGTHLVAVTPGKTETFGISAATVSNVRPLTLNDAEALSRLEQVTAVVPVVQGNAQVEARGRARRTMVLGVGSEVPAAWQMNVASGRFLPRDDQRAPRAFVVLGHRVKQELFSDRSALGQRLRVGGDRYRVIGVMEGKGRLLGFDLDDAVYIPAAKALELFNRESLMEVDLLYRSGVAADAVTAAARRLLVARHGSEDFTMITQQQMLDVLSSVLDVLTVAVGALGGISLIVGGVGVLTIMSIAVRERTGEIGLLRALGARRRDILGVFLLESLALAAVGGLGGLGLGLGLMAALRALVPALPLDPSLPFLLVGEALALVVGLAAGVMPARRAASLVPLDALRAE